MDIPVLLPVYLWIELTIVQSGVTWFLLKCFIPSGIQQEFRKLQNSPAVYPQSINCEFMVGCLLTA